MASITYRGEAHGPDQTVTSHGHVFRPHETVETDHPALIEMAKVNRFFEVVGAEEEGGQEEDFEGFTIKETGRGWFKILSPEGEEVASGLRGLRAAEDRALELATERRQV